MPVGMPVGSAGVGDAWGVEEKSPRISQRRVLNFKIALVYAGHNHLAIILGRKNSSDDLDKFLKCS